MRMKVNKERERENAIVGKEKARERERHGLFVRTCA